MDTQVSAQVLTALSKVLVVSKTDLKGNITYVNDLFCELTGFSKDELIGAPHSIVRHKSIDKEVYKDMWDTIKKGNVWTGIIPNVGKGGVVYVVDTTVQPIFDDEGTITEYISVRRVINDLMGDFDSVELSKEIFDDYYDNAA